MKMLIKGFCDERYPDWDFVRTNQQNEADHSENIAEEKVKEWERIQEEYESMQEEIELLFGWERAEEKAEAIKSGKIPYLLSK